MTYEIEKRSLFSSKKDFESAEKKISTLGKKTEYYKYKTFLYKSPSYLRIRISKGKPNAEITIKTGTYTDTARKEHNESIPLPKLPKYVKALKKKGFLECVSILAESQKYLIDGLEVAFNKIEHLGLIVEIEALTEEKSKIAAMENKVKNLMNTLQLKELLPEAYQKMMDEMHRSALKPVDEQKFILD